MSFIKEGFSTVGGNARKGPANSIFSYKNVVDSKQDMQADGYFNEAAFDVNTDDTIMCTASDGTMILHVVSSALVQGEGLVVVNNDLAEDSGGSTAFKSIHRLQDFDTDGSGNFLLKNGVNYQVYITGPVNTDKHFVFESAYPDGGSLVYMGVEGLLEWNITGDFFMQGTHVANLTAIFELRGFKITDSDKDSTKAIDDISFIDKRIISNCEFIDFSDIGIFTEQNFLRINLTKNSMSVGVPSGTNHPWKMGGSEMKIEDCEFLSNNISGAVAFDVNSIDKADIRNTDFIVPNATLQALELTRSGVPGSYINFNGCRTYKENGNVMENPFGTIQHGIKEVSAATGDFINIETYEATGVALGQNVQVWATKDYDKTNVEVAEVVDSTNFTVAEDNFVLSNFGGYVGYGGALDSFDTNSHHKINASNCIGIENSRSRGAAGVYASSTGQAFIGGSGVPYELAFPAGEYIGTPEGVWKNFHIETYGQISFMYNGLHPISVMASLCWTCEPTAAIRDYQMSIGAANFLFKTAFSASGASLGFSFDALIKLNPGDEIMPMLTPLNSTAALFIESVSFSLKEI